MPRRARLFETTFLQTPGINPRRDGVRPSTTLVLKVTNVYSKTIHVTTVWDDNVSDSVRREFDLGKHDSMQLECTTASTQSPGWCITAKCDRLDQFEQITFRIVTEADKENNPPSNAL